MNLNSSTEFEQIVCFDTEFSALGGNKLTPRCLVAQIINTGEIIHQIPGTPCPRLTELLNSTDTLFVAFYASAEVGYLLGCDLPIPKYLICLFSNFKFFTNGKKIHQRASLNFACQYFKIPTMTSSKKDAGRTLALKEGPLSDTEMAQR